MAFFLLFMFTLLSINANGLCNEDKRLSFIHWLQSLPSVIDFVCIRKSHCASDVECSAWFRSSGFSFVASHGTNRSCGVVVLFRPCFSVVKSWPGSSGCSLMVEFKCSDFVFCVCSLYAPNRNPDLDELLVDCAKLVDPSIPTLLCGDFNTVFDRLEDCCGSCPLDDSRKSTPLSTSLFSECCVADIWHLLHPSQPSFTWTRADSTIASRIDLIGWPYAWLAFVASCKILSCPYSNHAAVTLSWSPPDSPSRGPGLWKLNCSILDESDYYQHISDFWASWCLRRPSFSSLAHWWDPGKSRIKGLTINYCRDRQRSEIQERSCLSRLAEHLKAQIDSGAVSFLSVYHSVLSRLKALELVEAHGAQVRSHIKWVEQGETSSSYFLRLDK